MFLKLNIFTVFDNRYTPGGIHPEENSDDSYLFKDVREH